MNMKKDDLWLPGYVDRYDTNLSEVLISYFYISLANPPG